MGGEVAPDLLATAPVALEAIAVGVRTAVDPETLIAGWSALPGLAGDASTLRIPPGELSVSEDR